MSLETELYDKWVDGTLARDDIQAEVKRLTENIGTGLPGDKKYLAELLSEKDVQHVGFCLHKIYQWWWDRETVGPFLNAFIGNNLYLTWKRADAVNWLSLAVYMEYLHEHAPQTWRFKKAKDYERA